MYDLGVMRYNKKCDALKGKNMKKFNKINEFCKRLEPLRAHHFKNRKLMLSIFLYLIQAVKAQTSA